MKIGRTFSDKTLIFEFLSFLTAQGNACAVISYL